MAQDLERVGPLVMGAAVGVFFGTWAAFVSYGPRLDDESRSPLATSSRRGA